MRKGLAVGEDSPGSADTRSCAAVIGRWDGPGRAATPTAWWGAEGSGFPSSVRQVRHSVCRGPRGCWGRGASLWGVRKVDSAVEAAGSHRGLHPRADLLVGSTFGGEF